MSLLNKQLRGYNAVVRGQSKIADALSLDYTADDVAAHKAAAVASELRTDVARDIAERRRWGAQPALAEQGDDAGRVRHRGHLRAGRSSATRRSTATYTTCSARRGMAQLVAWKLHKEAKTGKVDLDASFPRSDRPLATSARPSSRSAPSPAPARPPRPPKRCSRKSAASEKGESLYTTTAARSLAAAQDQRGRAVARHGNRGTRGRVRAEGRHDL
jgi:hypothetical protein